MQLFEIRLNWHDFVATPTTTDLTALKAKMDLQKMAKNCPLDNCRDKVTLACSPCALCSVTFCLRHRFPEAHSEICTQKAKVLAHTDYKKESARMNTLRSKTQKSAVSKADVAKEQIDAKKRLKDAINQKKADRSKRV